MNIGSLYRVKKYFWLLFPSKESAPSAAADASTTAATTTVAAAAPAGADAAYLSKKFKENVTYFSPDSYIVHLKEDGMLKKILTSEGLIGWIWVEEYCDCDDCFEEVKSE